MKLFLLWRDHANGQKYPSAGIVSKRLSEIVALTTGNAPAMQHRSNAGINMVFQHLPPKGWNKPFVQEDAHRWVFAIDYPVDAEFVTRIPRGGNRGSLPQLCKKIESDPERWINLLSPPYSLVWHNKDKDAYYAVVDGMGFCKLYEYSDNGMWALSNRISAFAALGLSLVPDPVGWAVRWALTWFPGTTTGFKHVASLNGGTRIRVSQYRITRMTCNAMGNWVQPIGDSAESSLRRARSAMHEYLVRATSYLDPVIMSLSGGCDSRPVAAVLRSCGVPFTVRVRGEDWRPDVRIVNELCAIGDIPILRRSKSKPPSTEPGNLSESIIHALIFQSGFLSRRHHHTFRVHSRKLRPGICHITGRCGEIASASMLTAILSSYRDGDYIEHLIGMLMDKGPQKFLKKDVREEVRERIFFELKGYEQFSLPKEKFLRYYVFEKSVRSVYERFVAYSPTLTISPYLHPEIVRSSFTLSDELIASYAIHRHIVAADAPDWASVVYEKDMTQQFKDGTATDIAPGLEHEKVPSNANWLVPNSQESYNRKRFWREEVSGFVSDTLENGGLWEEIYDGDAVRRRGTTRPEEMLILSFLPEAVSLLEHTANSVQPE